MNKRYFIYTLHDPITNEIRYVGKTEKTLRRRLVLHCTEAKNSPAFSHKLNWIRSVLDSNMKPTIKPLEECTKENLSEREIYWIREGRRLGWRLTNSTDGGEGLLNPSEETRKKIGKLSKERNSGEKNPFWGKSHSEESRKIMGESRKGNKNCLGRKYSPETIHKMELVHRGQSSKLDEDKVRDIRRRAGNGEPHKNLVAEYGVSDTTISHVVSRKSWSWVK